MTLNRIHSLLLILYKFDLLLYSKLKKARYIGGQDITLIQSTIGTAWRADSIHEGSSKKSGQTCHWKNIKTRSKLTILRSIILHDFMFTFLQAVEPW